MNNGKIGIIGGDKRNVILSIMLEEDKMLCGTYGMEVSSDTGNLETLINMSDVIVGPTPFSNDGVTVNTPLCSEKVCIDSLITGMKAGQMLIAGKLSKRIHELAESKGVRTVDLLDREEMAVMNAIPTAEGALQIAMEELPVTLHGSSCLILGFGRIAKILAKMLSGIGAQTYVAARKLVDRTWIKTMGYTPLPLDEISGCASHIDVVFNTIPAVVINEHLLGRFRPDCLLLDLASRPGGIDFDRAKMLGLKSIWALSLPGKVAPHSAAQYIYSTIKNILKEGEGE